jgi:hypothetical protein
MLKWAGCLRLQSELEESRDWLYESWVDWTPSPYSLHLELGSMIDITDDD